MANDPIQITFNTGATIPFRPFTPKGKDYVSYAPLTPNGDGTYSKRSSVKVARSVLGNAMPASLKVCGVTVKGVTGVTTESVQTGRKGGKTYVSTPAGLPKVTFSATVMHNGQERRFLLWVHDFGDYFRIGGGLTKVAASFGAAKSEPLASL